MFTEVNTQNNLPAQIEIYSKPGDVYELFYMAKGGGSANKSFLYQKTKALLNEESLLDFCDETLRLLGTAACPPLPPGDGGGGTSAEHNLKVAKLASAKYLDSLPTSGDAATGHGFRDLEWEQRILEMTRPSASAPSSAQVLLPRRAGGAPAPPRGVQPGGDRGELLG